MAPFSRMFRPVRVGNADAAFVVRTTQNLRFQRLSDVLAGFQLPDEAKASKPRVIA